MTGKIIDEVSSARAELQHRRRRMDVVILCGELVKTLTLAQVLSVCLILDLSLSKARHPRSHHHQTKHQPAATKFEILVSRTQHLQIRPPRLATQLGPRGILLTGL